jgi:AraC family transcriptional regulator
MNYISHNIERDLSLEEIAKVAAFSPFHFHRVFKAVAGETTGEFTRRLRIELAANRMLTRPETGITSIAAESGFSSSQNFARAFRQRFGVSPTEYRERAAKLGKGAAGERKRPESGPAERKAASRETTDLAVTVYIERMPVSTAASVRRIGPYTPETCLPAFGELLGWAACQPFSASGVPSPGPGPGKLIAIYWDNPEVTPPARCRFDCCLIVPPDAAFGPPVFTQRIGGGWWAFCGAEAAPDEIPRAWEAAFRWLVGSGYGCRSVPCYEIYHNDAREHPEGKWIIDIAIPLEER